MANTNQSEDTTNRGNEEPKIILDMDNDDAEMVEEVLTDGGIKPDVIRRV